jgi:hypothetical protein
MLKGVGAWHENSVSTQTPRYKEQGMMINSQDEIFFSRIDEVAKVVP